MCLQRLLPVRCFLGLAPPARFLWKLVPASCLCGAISVCCFQTFVPLRFWRPFFICCWFKTVIPACWLLWRLVAACWLRISIPGSWFWLPVSAAAWGGLSGLTACRNFASVKRKGLLQLYNASKTPTVCIFLLFLRFLNFYSHFQGLWWFPSIWEEWYGA